MTASWIQTSTCAVSMEYGMSLTILATAEIQTTDILLRSMARLALQHYFSALVYYGRSVSVKMT